MGQPMINFYLNITNPWSTKFSNIKYWSGPTFLKHKFWEFQIMRTADIIEISSSFSSRQDHAGLEFSLGLLGLALRLNIYDNRHWNYDVGAWEIYQE